VRQLESDRERGWDSERECIAVLLNVLATLVILCSVVLYLSICLSVYCKRRERHSAVERASRRRPRDFEYLC
jgi:hypothetical protein